jgi:bidirectional [NiFe] hydrogenase diaphorase subunit
MSVLTLTIEGRDVAGQTGHSILQVARENGIHIPTLCHLQGLSDVGACRLCVVEVEGQRKLLPACVTAIDEGMTVTVNSERLAAYRRRVIELLFTERNHVCSVCVADRNCGLQDLAVELGLTHFDLPLLSPQASVDATHERFGIDHNRCVLCTRCVRDGPRHGGQADQRPGYSLGRFQHLHQLREVCSGVSHRSPLREGEVGRRGAAPPALPAVPGGS